MKNVGKKREEAYQLDSVGLYTGGNCLSRKAS